MSLLVAQVYILLTYFLQMIASCFVRKTLLSGAGFSSFWRYEKGSGQRLNKEKTSIFFSKNTRPEAKDLILTVAGIKSSQSYDKYLGLPIQLGRDRIKYFKSIIDRVRSRISNWKIKHLSQAGKEILIKAVLQAIPTYSMGVFKLPKSMLEELTRLIRQYW